MMPLGNRWMPPVAVLPPRVYQLVLRAPLNQRPLAQWQDKQRRHPQRRDLLRHLDLGAPVISTSNNQPVFLIS